ncbi:MAG: alpha/beta hydrolase [Bacteroidota bacterium]|nr:alpha/beta hydrolase [Bacteroidota bacterium]
MKNTILTVCLYLFSYTTQAQSVTGSWQGAIQVRGNQIHINFHIRKDSSGYSATMDSPDQKAYGILCNETRLEEDSLKISIALVKGGYAGKWNGTDQIDGLLLQGPIRMPLVLTRMKENGASKDPAMADKPQTPRPPFPYLTEEVGYENKQESVHLAGSFTKPATGNHFPVVLMITGSGPQDRDESIGKHKPFAVIADYLTRQGIAVLRVDDRGVGKSTGDFSQATSADFATDVMAGIDYLKTRTDIDPKKIGLIGHSEGGIIAPYVAARSKDIAFVVLLAGPVTGGKQTMYYQAVDKPLAKLPAADRKAYGDLYTKMFAIALDSQIAKQVPEFVKQTYLDWKKTQPDSILAHLIHGTDEQAISQFSNGFGIFTRPWWRFFLSYDPAKNFASLQIPVLAFYGEKDEQVDPVANTALINQLKKKMKQGRITVVEIPGVNHLFQHCKNCGSVQEYLDLDETFDTGTLSVMGQWIKDLLRNQPGY